MKKRSIISIVLLMVVTGLIFSTIYSFTAKPQKNIGLQLYSIRDSIMKNVPAAIAKVGKMGYKFVEPANYDNGKLYGMEPAAFKELCLSNGLTILSSHVGQSLPDSANLGKTMAWWGACIDAHVAAIWGDAAKAGMQYGIVEVEEYNFDQFTSCQKSLDFLNATPYVVMPK